MTWFRLLQVSCWLMALTLVVTLWPQLSALRFGSGFTALSPLCKFGVLFLVVLPPLPYFLFPLQKALWDKKITACIVCEDAQALHDFLHHTVPTVSARMTTGCK
jgi:hypothetical protein